LKVFLPLPVSLTGNNFWTLGGYAMQTNPAIATPIRLVLIAFPVLFVLAPDGIPHALAVCPSIAGTAHGAQAGCTTCTETSSNPQEKITCSVTESSLFCRITGTVTYSILISPYPGNACDTLWQGWCGTPNPQVCDTVNGDTGPVTDITRSKTADCGNLNDEIGLSLEGAANCSCTTGGGIKRVFYAETTHCTN
jgi:hypothetical protein